MNRDQRCWLCHKLAPAGVCMGPHDYTRRSHSQAKHERHIEAGPMVAKRPTEPKRRPGRPRKQPLPPCPWCHGAVTPDRLGDWCEACERIVPQQQQRRVA